MGVASASLAGDLERRLRVVVAGGDPLARSGLQALLSDQPGLSIVALADLGPDLRLVLERERPDASVWDLGIEAKLGIERLRDLDGSVPVLALVTDDADGQELLAAGARGVLLRDSDAARIAAALFAVAQQIVVLEPGMGLPGPRVPSDERAPIEPLTRRESEVLQLLAQGLSNKEIAQRLKVSEHTAKFHVNAILSKLGVQSRTEAVVKAARLSLILI